MRFTNAPTNPTCYPVSDIMHAVLNELVRPCQAVFSLMTWRVIQKTAFPPSHSLLHLVPFIQILPGLSTDSIHSFVNRYITRTSEHTPEISRPRGNINDSTYIMLFSNLLALALCTVTVSSLPVGQPDTTAAAIETRADSGPGIDLTNKSKKKQTYFFFDNYWNGNGEAGANFDKPLKSVTLNAGASQHVPLPLTFKGRVQRGKDIPATWVEFQIKADDDGGAHGDISVQQGCDGAATIASTEAPFKLNGFTNDVVTGAPADAIQKKPDGTRAIASTEGNWLGGPNLKAIEYMNKVVGQPKAYIVGGTGVPDIASSNNRLAVVMY
ncbi:unnamed protein product [Periconia digitata]|uniref:Uncharacterized protein n=1 Tax=Periconia digitata TaxID=1303443 RepID=A0A9W4UUG7_9PLEO|nr:unnamed protein product [Periconia digitata]